MKRISRKEKKYALKALTNQFRTSASSVFNTALEKKFAKVFGVKYSIAHVNGTATLHTALAALGIGPGDEVIVPPLTMSSTSIAVLHAGAVPVFADVDLRTFMLSPEAIKKCVTPKTRAIITVSLYGLSPDYDGIQTFCRKRGLSIIEDNAQCVLGTYKSKLVGQFGKFSSYSFQASKHLTCGEGGMLTTNELDLADRARKFGSLGYAGVSAGKGKISRVDIQDPAYDRHVTLGFNYRMSEVDAAVALGQLERVEELIARRIEVANLFGKAVQGIKYLSPQQANYNAKNVYWSYAMVLEVRKPSLDWYRFRDLFQKNGGDGFYAAWKLTYEEPLFKKKIQKMSGVWQQYKKGLCETAEYLQPRLIQLKTNYWDLREAKKQAAVLKKTAWEFSPS